MFWWYLGYTIDLWYIGCHACALLLSHRLTNLENRLDPCKPNDEDPKQKQTILYFIIGHLDAENYNKFVSEDGKDPSKLWYSITEHHASTSVENVASHFSKIFSIIFPSSSSGISESITLFFSTLKLLFSLSPSLFAGDIMPQVLALYMLRMLPEACRHVSTAVFHSIKVSTQIPTVEEVLKEIELEIVQKTDTNKESNMALKATMKPKR
ncbi:hypothetical protein O181_114763 [Austropuccinia psidii MF-1]|uniref:Uncharacterized protein n=1 Tax=Austropuccinia psidii MF-1 TaxID=1389203 RepID=A0A9Q3K526_9BASI|nr:hypothetical protein [Austropuccinia psidii MF-1]